MKISQLHGILNGGGAPLWLVLVVATAVPAQDPPAAAEGGVVVIDDARVALIRDVRVPAREAGSLIELTVQEGSRVERDQVLGQLDSALERQQAEAARLQQQIAEVETRNDVNLRYSEKSREVAEADVARAERAVNEYPKSISRAEMDQLRLVAERSALAGEQALLEMDSARLTSAYRAREVAIAEQHLENRRIVAPVSGVVVDVYAEVGEWLQAGAPVVRVVQLDRMRVEAFVNGYRYGKSLEGRPVTLSSRLPPDESAAEWRGVVTFVSPVMNPVTGEVMVLAEVENPDHRLLPGMLGRLTIHPAAARAEQGR